MSEVPQITNEADRKKVRDAVNKVVDSMHRVAAERELVNGILNALKEDTDLQPKHARQLAKMKFNENKDEVEAERDDIMTLYETIIEGK
jgi:hypothetical protein